MSLKDYRKSLVIGYGDYPFYSLIMAAMRQADGNNVEKLKVAFPEVWDELFERYYSPEGRLETD